MEFVIAKIGKDPAQVVLKFIHSLDLDVCVREYSKCPSIVLSHPLIHRPLSEWLMKVYLNDVDCKGDPSHRALTRNILQQCRFTYTKHKGTKCLNERCGLCHFKKIWYQVMEQAAYDRDFSFAFEIYRAIYRVFCTEIENRSAEYSFGKMFRKFIERSEKFQREFIHFLKTTKLLDYEFRFFTSYMFQYYPDDSRYSFTREAYHDLLNMCIDEGMDWNNVLCWACVIGDEKLVDRSLNNLQKRQLPIEYDAAFISACATAKSTCLQQIIRNAKGSVSEEAMNSALYVMAFTKHRGWVTLSHVVKRQLTNKRRPIE